MYQVTVGSKYQIVIPKEVREKVSGIRPGSKIGIYVSNGEVAIKTKPEDWIKRTQGMMTKSWRGFDTTKELEKMRDEWEKGLQEIEKIIK